MHISNHGSGFLATGLLFVNQCSLLFHIPMVVLQHVSIMLLQKDCFKSSTTVLKCDEQHKECQSRQQQKMTSIITQYNNQIRFAHGQGAGKDEPLHITGRAGWAGRVVSLTAASGVRGSVPKLSGKFAIFLSVFCHFSNSGKDMISKINRAFKVWKQLLKG